MSKNRFGGGNKNSLYVPMSEVEQEVISRLVEAEDLRVVIVGWGHVDRPRVTFGDARLSVAFQLTFDRPEIPMAVPFLDLELRTGAGVLLFRARQSTEYGGQPIQVASGVSLGMVWDIAVHSIDRNLVRAVVPSATGLTSRRQDKDTGDITREGNMHLDERGRRLLKHLEDGEARARAVIKGKVRKAGG